MALSAHAGLHLARAGAVVRHRLEGDARGGEPHLREAGLGLMPFGNSPAESQRDSGSKPKVARHELPWETVPQARNPNGVVALPDKCDATPLGLKIVPLLTQEIGRAHV